MTKRMDDGDGTEDWEWDWERKSQGSFMWYGAGVMYRTIVPRCKSAGWLAGCSTRHGRVGVLTRLTQSRIEHVQRHLVALLGTGDSHEALVVVVLGFVNLDDTSAELADLVDLGAALADDSADHVVRDEDLLSDRLAGE